MYLRFGNFLRRVAIEKVRPDIHSESQREEEEEDELENDTAKFQEEETPVEEMAEDLELAEKIKDLEIKNIDLQAELDCLTDDSQRLPESDVAEEVKEGDAKDIVEVTENGDEEQMEEKTIALNARKDKKKAQRLKKLAAQVKVPKTGDNIEFKEKNKDGWKTGRVVASWKKNSIYKYWKHLLQGNGLVVEKDFENGIEEWNVIPETDTREVEDANEDDYELDTTTNEAFPVHLIPPKDYGLPEVQAAIKAEINKYKSFNAIKEVDDEGQKCVPTKWVVTDQKASGKNEPFKARMCIRGDLEKGKESIRSDSPTASKDAIKLALTIAANEGFKVKSGDIKSAYLQGELLNRKIYVKPPKEANTSGKLWLLLQGAYGIVDGGRLFYLKLSEKLISLSMHKVNPDGSLFTYVKNGKFHGLITTHSDDLILAGDEHFEEDVESKLKEMFEFSKIEENAFKYCGCNIVSKENGSIELDQNEYINSLEELEVPRRDDNDELSKQEIKSVRSKIGELLWISLMTRPDISFDVNVLSSEVANGTISTIKAANRVIKKAKFSQSVLRFVRLGDLSDLSIKVYADASYANQLDKVRSTAGRIILIQNKKKGSVNVVSWKTKKIGRVCRSVKSAETRALEEAIDDAVNIARLVTEVYTGKVNLKDPAQIPVEGYTDSKSLWESLHNTRQCEEKILRNSIASIKELMDLKMVEEVSWVPTKHQLADCMTKRGQTSGWLLRVASHNRLDLYGFKHIMILFSIHQNNEHL